MAKSDDRRIYSKSIQNKMFAMHATMNGMYHRHMNRPKAIKKPTKYYLVNDSGQFAHVENDSLVLKEGYKDAVSCIKSMALEIIKDCDTPLKYVKVNSFLKSQIDLD
jgi:hypothetical protein